MTEYKKEAPVNRSNKAINNEPLIEGIEAYLSEIIDCARSVDADLEYIEPLLGRIEHYARCAWDLIDEESYEYRSINEQRRKIYGQSESQTGTADAPSQRDEK